MASTYSLPSYTQNRLVANNNPVIAPITSNMTHAMAEAYPAW